MRIELALDKEDRRLLQDIRRLFMGFSDSIAKLDVDVQALITATGPSAIVAAVEAKDAADAAAVDAIDQKVVSATPVPTA